MTVKQATVAVVVHHDSLDTLPATLGDLAAAGLTARQVVVVDNSESKVKSEDLERAVAGRAAILRTANRGYAAAANLGFAWATEKQPDVSAFLLVTHEVRLPQETLAAMTAVLVTDSKAGAVGPVLRDGGQDGAIWSTGGYLTRRLRIPQHHQLPIAGTTEREWLDGACVLYRRSAVTGRKMSESYFLYLEEVDFHQQLRAGGWKILATPFEASQSSKGMPGRFATRNIRILERRWGRPGWRAVAPRYVLARQLARRLLRREGDSVRAMLAGWREGRDIR